MDEAKRSCRPAKKSVSRLLKAPETNTMLLPSGRNILVRRPDPAKLALVPSGFIVRYAGPEDGPHEGDPPKEKLREYAEIIGDILDHCCVEPGVSRSLSWQDWIYIARWATGQLQQGRAEETGGQRQVKVESDR